MARAPRFRAFVEANETKIRRKLRQAPDVEAVLDVWAELRTAARLLADRRFDLAFEAYGARRPGPDFSITFRGVVHLDLEVTRRRGPSSPAAVVDATVAKLRQLPPSVANVVLVLIDRPVGTEDLGAAFRDLRSRVDARDGATLARIRAERPRDFYDRFLRLGAVLAWSPDAPPPAPVASWMNASARIALDRKAYAALLERFAAG